MSQAGLSPVQVLSASTKDAAACIGVDAEAGTLNAGKWADFIVLNGDPLLDVNRIRDIDSVWIAANRVPR